MKSPGRKARAQTRHKTPLVDPTWPFPAAGGGDQGGLRLLKGVEAEEAKPATKARTRCAAPRFLSRLRQPSPPKASEEKEKEENEKEKEELKEEKEKVVPAVKDCRPAHFMAILERSSMACR